MVFRGAPEYIRSNNGLEFVAKKQRAWLHDIGTTTLYIEPGSPWENGYVESFNSKMRDEFLNVTLFDTYKEAQILTRMWVKDYNMVRPHSSLGYRPSAYQSIAA